MKASNLIIILFAVIFWGGTLLLEKPKSAPIPVIAKTKKMDQFSVVVAQPGSQVFLQMQFSDNKFPTYSHVSHVPGNGELSTSPSFGVRNDTLFVFATSGKKEHENDSFYCTKIKSIVGMEKSVIKVWDIKVDTLKVKLSYANFSGFVSINPDRKRGTMLVLDADSSTIDMTRSPSNFAQIHIRLCRSHLKILGPTNSFCPIYGTMKDYSGLYITGGAVVYAKKDATSYSNL
jgi:hypothetical protein